MTALTFTPATRSEAKARVAIIGPTGAGKTWTALAVATCEWPFGPLLGRDGGGGGSAPAACLDTTIAANRELYHYMKNEYGVYPRAGVCEASGKRPS